MQKSALLFFIILVTISCNHLTSKTIQGEGSSSTADRAVGSFEQVQSFGDFDLIISNGSSAGVKVQAEQNLQQYIEVTVENNSLNIRHAKNVNLHSPNGIKIFITAPSLRAMRLFGSGNIRTENQMPSPDHLDIESYGSGDINYDLKAASVKAHISGSGNMTLSGGTDEFQPSINGSGNIKARNLDSKTTSVNISGSGNAEVVAKEKLSANISGSGSVLYWGQPEVNTHIMGSGTVKREN